MAWTRRAVRLGRGDDDAVRATTAQRRRGPIASLLANTAANSCPRLPLKLPPPERVLRGDRGHEPQGVPAAPAASAHLLPAPGWPTAAPPRFWFPDRPQRRGTCVGLDRLADRLPPRAPDDSPRSLIGADGCTAERTSGRRKHPRARRSPAARRFLHGRRNYDPELLAGSPQQQRVPSGPRLAGDQSAPAGRGRQRSARPPRPTRSRSARGRHPRCVRSNRVRRDVDVGPFGLPFVVADKMRLHRSIVRHELRPSRQLCPLWRVAQSGEPVGDRPVALRSP